MNEDKYTLKCGKCDMPKHRPSMPKDMLRCECRVTIFDEENDRYHIVGSTRWGEES